MVASENSKKSEKFQNDIWSDIEEPPVDGTSMFGYAVIFYGSSHYYFGGSLNFEPFTPKNGKNLIANYSLISLSTNWKNWWTRVS